jgi:iron(III) transport system substrate-binding protein
MRPWLHLWAIGLACACGRVPAREVVVYTSVDQVFSEPVLTRFERETGIRVRAVYDTEEAKSTGVVNRLIAEGSNPQADVFWSGDVFRCLVLKSKGFLTPHRAPDAVPQRFRDRDGMWTGFSGRARVLVYDRDEVQTPLPSSLEEFTTPARAGELSIANPLFGTTTVHVAALFVALGDERARALLDGLKANGAHRVSSNSESLRAALSGGASFGLTDTDDAFVALRDGRPVGLLFPDQNGVGTLFMPNAVALVRGGPDPKEGQELIDFLLTSAVEGMLRDAAGQIPVLPGTEPPADLPLDHVKWMDVDYEAIARKVDEIQPYLRSWAGM